MSAPDLLTPDELGGIAISDPNAPTEGSDAGGSDDLDEAYAVGVIENLRGEALRQFALAQEALARGDDEAEFLAQRALSCAVRGFWWAEERPEEESLHELLHEIGRWKRQNMGCELHYDEQRGYLQNCLVAAAHRRMGFSIGFVGKRICSLCDQDLSECPHLNSRSYWVRGGSSPDQPCRVCMRDQCEHRSDHLYRARVVSVVKPRKVREVSLVSRPANPECRILAISVSFSELEESLGDLFAPGIIVNCDVCLGECPGFAEIDLGPHPNFA